MPGSAEQAVLRTVYDYYSSNKYAFEYLASVVTGEVLGKAYIPGWVTQGRGDASADFVGRLDVGSESSMAGLVVLGQAKCKDPTSSISAEELARVVARLRRGWIGAFVTTCVFSRAAQEEMIDDQYPIILIDGLRLSQIVRRMALATYGGDVNALLDDVLQADPGSIMNRRPEEVLTV